jgi:hypothetical protein
MLPKDFLSEYYKNNKEYVSRGSGLLNTMKSLSHSVTSALNDSNQMNTQQKRKPKRKRMHKKPNILGKGIKREKIKKKRHSRQKSRGRDTLY